MATYNYDVLASNPAILNAFRTGQPLAVATTYSAPVTPPSSVTSIIGPVVGAAAVGALGWFLGGKHKAIMAGAGALLGGGVGYYATMPAAPAKAA